jgi:hypothetical protein
MIQNAKKQPIALTLIICSFAFLLLASAVSGCQVEDFVKVDVPNGIAEATASEPTIPLSKADATLEDWKAYVERNTRQFTDEIDRGAETAAIIRSITETGISVVDGASSTLPGGAIISTGLALLGGLFLKRPGEEKRVRTEKEDSYNAGLETATSKMAAAVSEAFLASRNVASNQTPREGSD